MGHSRLNHLKIIQIEHERSININLDEVINNFNASAKLRERQLQLTN